MQIQFSKYQGTGNDFIMIDDRHNECILDDSMIKNICNRKLGIGADGVILIRNYSEGDFEMVYYNSDGSQSLCGNGSRCAVKFAQTLGIIENEAKFLTVDGTYTAQIRDEIVELNMKSISEIQEKSNDYFIHNGSPHYIIFNQDNDNTDVVKEGRKIRYNDEYKEDGTNVNFVQVNNVRSIHVRTYERGVEDETLSCGTGVMASALASTKKGVTSPISVETLGGKLEVKFDHTPADSYENIVLSGPATFVFKGTIEVN